MATGDDLAELRQQVLAANQALPAQGLVTLTWGNVSGIDRKRGLVVIKPSGVPYEALQVDSLVVVDLEGRVVDGDNRPSTDTPTHLALYRALPDANGVVHTHSTWATAWAQAGRQIPVLGTTHADLCPGPVPLTGSLGPDEVEAGYEEATGALVVEAMGGRPVSEVPAVLVRGHGPFTMGHSPAAAVEHAVTVEAVAKLALLTTVLEAEAPVLPQFLLDKHFSRKHGPGAYYGQVK